MRRAGFVPETYRQRHHGDSSISFTFPARQRTDPWRRQLAGARVSRGRRAAPVHRARGRALSLRRGWRPLYRLRPELGSTGAGPRASPRGRAAGGRVRPRGQLRCADRARGGAGRARGRPGAVSPDGSLRQLWHRGDDERAAPGARVHGPRQDHQVRGLLSWPCRHAPGAGRQRRRHARAARQPRRAPRRGARHVGGALQ